MIASSAFYRIAIVSLCFASRLLSATTGDKIESATDSTFQSAMADALKLQEDTAAAVAGQREKADAALMRIKAMNSPSGLRMADHDADFAFSASAIGQRLIGLQKRTDALTFFSAAEQALALAVARMPDSSTQDKAMLLQQLAYLRGHYLDQPAQAQRDFEEAIKLRPDDEWLRRARDSFANEHADLNRTTGTDKK